MRSATILINDLKFKKFELNQVEDNVFSTDFDDSDWREISIPHDWGIEGDFAPDNDPSRREISQDGITTAILHTGRTGALPPVGEGVYRKWVKLDNPETAFLEFDGIMWESNVYVNGKKVGGCHFGYLSFEVDITDAIVPGDNLIAIHAIVHPASSRRYSGDGKKGNVTVKCSSEGLLRAKLPLFANKNKKRTTNKSFVFLFYLTEPDTSIYSNGFTYFPSFLSSK